jgi:hypothetical protein
MTRRGRLPVPHHDHLGAFAIRRRFEQAQETLQRHGIDSEIVSRQSRVPCFEPDPQHATGSGALDAAIGGWQLGVSFNARSGLPVNLNINRPNVLYRDNRTGLYYRNGAPDSVRAPLPVLRERCKIGCRGRPSGRPWSGRD